MIVFDRLNTRKREKIKRQRYKQINRQNKRRYKERERERMDGKHKEEKREARDILIFVITSLSFLSLTPILIYKMFLFVDKAA
jgi:hypothetical protein